MDEAPLYVDIMLAAVYLLLAVATAAAVYASWHGLRTHSSERSMLDLRHAKAISYAALLLPVGCLVLTFLLGSAEPLLVNGRPFADAFWLRLTDMFIFTSVILILVCSAIVVVGKFRH